MGAKQARAKPQRRLRQKEKSGMPTARKGGRGPPRGDPSCAWTQGQAVGDPHTASSPAALLGGHGSPLSPRWCGGWGGRQSCVSGLEAQPLWTTQGTSEYVTGIVGDTRKERGWARTQAPAGWVVGGMLGLATCPRH